MVIIFNQQINMDTVNILSSVKKILLVDWPDRNLPVSLVLCGFTVYGYSPGNYTRISISERPEQTSDKYIQKAPLDHHANMQLIFESLRAQPELVDLVSIYRPDEEMEEITQKHILPMQARIMWIQPPAHSSNAPALAEKYNLTLVQDIDLAEMADRIRKSQD